VVTFAWWGRCLNLCLLVFLLLSLCAKSWYLDSSIVSCLCSGVVRGGCYVLLHGGCGFRVCLRVCLRWGRLVGVVLRMLDITS